MSVYIFWTVFLTTIWMTCDAAILKIPTYGDTYSLNTGALAWFVAAIFLWILTFPYYLVRRSSILRQRQEMARPQAAPPPAGRGTLSDQEKDKLFCEVGVDLNLLTKDQVEKALEQQRVDRAIGVTKPIGAYFFEATLISKDQIAQILKIQDKYGKPSPQPSVSPAAIFNPVSVSPANSTNSVLQVFLSRCSFCKEEVELEEQELKAARFSCPRCSQTSALLGDERKETNRDGHLEIILSSRKIESATVSSSGVSNYGPNNLKTRNLGLMFVLIIISFGTYFIVTALSAKPANQGLSDSMSSQTTMAAVRSQPSQDQHSQSTPIKAAEMPKSPVPATNNLGNLSQEQASLKNFVEQFYSAIFKADFSPNPETIQIFLTPKLYSFLCQEAKRRLAEDEEDEPAFQFVPGNDGASGFSVQEPIVSESVASVPVAFFFTGQPVNPSWKVLLQLEKQNNGQWLVGNVFFFNEGKINGDAISYIIAAQSNPSSEAVSQQPKAVAVANEKRVPPAEVKQSEEKARRESIVEELPADPAQLIAFVKSSKPSILERSSFPLDYVLESFFDGNEWRHLTSKAGKEIVEYVGSAKEAFLKPGAEIKITLQYEVDRKMKKATLTYFELDGEKLPPQAFTQFLMTALGAAMQRHARDAIPDKAE